MTESFLSNIHQALNARTHLVHPPHNTAFRLFNGFTEGDKRYVIDLFGRTAVIHDYSVQSDNPTHRALAEILQSALPFLSAAVLKPRKSTDARTRNGVLLFGDRPDGRIVEHEVKYALDITMNQDASFYIDTRNLRQWVLAHLSGKRVLNTFAYTGSIGVAALSAGAEVVQTDLNRTFLNLAKQSYSMNGFPIHRRQFISGDFFVVMKQLSRQQQQFDCVILDPPFFSKTERGTVDIEQNMTRLINKVRPIVADGGHIIAVNNAIYVSGKEYIDNLQNLCVDGHVSIESIIDIPEDCTGYPSTRKTQSLTDPAPFNHGTKIAVLGITRKP